MMVLKGYACSIDWPKPEHRPCGDIDIWLFGKQKEADALLVKDKGVIVDTSHHHHTVFDWGGFMVENHFDFINVHHHKSNAAFESLFKMIPIMLRWKVRRYICHHPTCTHFSCLNMLV